VAAKVAFGTAVDYAMRVGVGRAEKRIRYLAATLREDLAVIPGVRVLDLDGPGEGCGKCGIVTADVEELGGAEAVARAALREGVALSVSPPMSTLNDSSRRGVQHGILRFSPHYFNTHADLDVAVGAVAAVAAATAGLRRAGR
jgi:cysteine desulfurase/selenocysteine lyase